MIISINGVITDKKNAKISVLTDMFLYGHAAFEVVRTFNQKIFRLNDHLARLYISADIMCIKPKWTLKKTHDAVAKVLSKCKKDDLKIRIILAKNDLVIMAEKLKVKDPSLYRDGVKLVSYYGKRNIPYAKKLADPFSYLAKKHAVSCGVFESLLIDPKTYVRECAYANIFWVNGKKLHSTNKEILFGITRETVIELAGKCEFDGIKYKTLLNADEVFITQTTSGILPVVEIDGHKIGAGKPGNVTKELMQKYAKLVWQNKIDK